MFFLYSVICLDRYSSLVYWELFAFPLTVLVPGIDYLFSQVSLQFLMLSEKQLISELWCLTPSKRKCTYKGDACKMCNY